MKTRPPLGRALPAHQAPVETHLVGAADARAERRRLPIDGEAPGADPRFRFTARGQPGARQHLLQALRLARGLAAAAVRRGLPRRRCSPARGRAGARAISRPGAPARPRARASRCPARRAHRPRQAHPHRRCRRAGRRGAVSGVSAAPSSPGSASCRLSSPMALQLRQRRQLIEALAGRSNRETRAWCPAAPGRPGTSRWPTTRTQLRSMQRA